jgi:hypothetical protein
MSSIRRLFIVAAGLAVLVVLLTIGVVLASSGQLDGKLLTGSDVTITADETIGHDVYVFGGTLLSNGTINGDIVVAAGNVDVNGPVNGDVLVAGGRIVIAGPITGDVRAAGGQVTITGNVTEDVLAAGGQVNLNGRIGQDLIVSGGQLTLTGTVAGGAVGTVGTISGGGTIGGTNSITVTGNDNPSFAPARPNPVLDAIRQFIAVMLVAVLALWLAPRLFAAAETEARARALPSFGYGIVAVIAYIVAIVVIVMVMVLLAIVLAVLGFGGLLGIDIFGGIVLILGLTLAFVVAAGFLADAIVGLALGRLLAGRSDRLAAAAQRSSAMVRARWADLGLIAVGVAIVVVLTSLPIVGGWLKLVVVLLGLGSLWLARRWPVVARPTVPPDATPPPAAPAPR